MEQPIDILCIGAVLWDTIGRAPVTMKLGHDCGGRIRRLPGGVAFNVAAACRAAGMRPAMLGLLGEDDAGRDLAAHCAELGIEMGLCTRSPDLATDQYMAIEAPNGLIAAIADAHSLEAAGDSILAPLRDGRLGTADAPYPGRIALDGNLTEALLADLAQSPLLAAADLRVAPASPGKVARIAPFLAASHATVYVNRIEAGLLCGRDFDTAQAAASALAEFGPARLLVTDGAAPVAERHGTEMRIATPPEVDVRRVTGAGDTFLAAHIAAEVRGESPQSALTTALADTARFIAAP